MSTKYGFSDVREQLVHILEGAYPTKWETYQPASVVGEEVFGSPGPHPNAVLNLLLEQNIRFAIPLASYRAAVGGFPSLLSDEPGATLQRLPLATVIYGMDTIQGELSQLAHLVVCNLGLRECQEEWCAASEGVGSADQRMKRLNNIYDNMVKEGKGDVFSLSLGRTVCPDCAEAQGPAYRIWCATIWEDFPRIFGVGESWEDV
jgi:hypothetical protein